MTMLRAFALVFVLVALATQGAPAVGQGASPISRLPAPERLERLERLDQIGPWISRCWRPPFEEPIGRFNEVTVRFSFRRDGTVLGQPTITFASRELPESVREAYRMVAVQMLARCSPVPLSDKLGSAIAGRPFTMRFRVESDGRALRSI
jgi:hypothetical protein